MSTVKISALTEKATMVGTEEVLINDSGTSKKFSTQRFLDVKTDCETAETNASASAVAAASSAASAASVYDSFDDRYLGNKTADPTLDNDGDALVSGALYFNTTDGNMMVYDGSAWITTSSAVLSTLVLHKFTATASQTVFTGTDDDGGTLSIKPTAEMVTLNGIVLESGADYTVTTTTLTLLTGATVNDEVNVYAFGNFELADHYNKAASDARYEPIDSAYTKAESDAAYEPIDSAYTKAEDDARFLGLAGGTMTGNLSLGDAVKATFGASDDLEIEHNGSHSIIKDNGTGQLYLMSNGAGVYLYDSANTQPMLNAYTGSAVNLYHNGSEKLATTATGVDVTGSVTCDGFTSTGIDDNATSTAITIDASENVGIGTTAPSAKLHIESTSGDGLKIKRTSSGTAGGIGVGATSQGLAIYATDHYANTPIVFRMGQTDSSNNPFVGGSEKMRIHYDGNVGIGTTSPSSALEVNGTVTATTVDLGNWTVTESAGVLKFATGGVNKMKLDASGNLTVVGNVTAYGTI